jgi:hypothetical protein
MEVNGVSDLKLTELDWELLQSIGIVLQVTTVPPKSIFRFFDSLFQVPHRVQHTMSAESMPVLSSTVGIFEIFMAEWEDLEVKYSKLRPWIQVGLAWAKKYYKFMDDTDAYIITMGESFAIVFYHKLMTDGSSLVVLNPCIRLRWITEQWEKGYISYSRKTILKCVSTYYILQTPTLNRYQRCPNIAAAKLCKASLLWPLPPFEAQRPLHHASHLKPSSRQFSPVSQHISASIASWMNCMALVLILLRLGELSRQNLKDMCLAHLPLATQISFTSGRWASLTSSKVKAGLHSESMTGQ